MVEEMVSNHPLEFERCRNLCHGYVHSRTSWFQIGAQDCIIQRRFLATCNVHMYSLIAAYQMHPYYSAHAYIALP